MKNQIPLWFEDCVQIGNNIWFPAANLNGLFQYDILNGGVKFVALFENEKKHISRLFYKVYMINDCIVFIPNMASEMYMYDTLLNKMHSIQISECEHQRFVIAAVYENQLLLQRVDENKFYVFDFSERILKKPQIYNFIESPIHNMTQGIVVENKYYAGNKENNIVVSFDFVNRTIETIALGTDSKGYRMIGEFDNMFLCDDIEGTIYQISKDGNTVKKMFVSNLERGIYDLYYEHILLNDILFSFVLDKNIIVKHDLKTLQSEIIEETDVEQFELNNELTRRWGCIKKIDKGILTISNRTTNVKLIGEKLTYSYLVFDKRDYLKKLKELKMEMEYNDLERTVLDLEIYLSCCKKKKKNLLNTNVGRILYKE